MDLHLLLSYVDKVSGACSTTIGLVSTFSSVDNVALTKGGNGRNGVCDWKAGLAAGVAMP